MNKFQNTLVALLFACATLHQAPAQQVIDANGMVWASKDTEKVVISEQSRTLYVVKNDECKAFANMTITRTGNRIYAMEDKAQKAWIDLLTGEYWFEPQTPN